ncbi:MAG: DUF6516 family protein [Anaerolineae bacterium]|nr:DUF6516 family protein [Anaerolineae bacterium]
MNPFRSLRDYEIFVYTLPQQYPRIVLSTLTVIRRGKYRAEVMGDLLFLAGIRLSVYEHLIWDDRAVEIAGYSYEVWCGSEKLYWYDSQPHPNDPALAATDPHHKHIPPDIKHHRVPAHDLSFTRPNLPFLIEEIERTVLGQLQK